MPTTITQFYASEKKASEVAAALKKTFKDERVKMDRKYTGNAAVSVEVEPDKALTAIQILNDQSAAGNSDTSGIRDNPAPLSSLLGLPVLSHKEPHVTLLSEPAPLSKMLGLPTIISDKRS